MKKNKNYISTDRIPNGEYCYDENGVCPYLKRISAYGRQNDGYCSFLNEGDWEDGVLGLLWDQCKCCGIKVNDDCPVCNCRGKLDDGTPCKECGGRGFIIITTNPDFI